MQRNRGKHRKGKTRYLFKKIRDTKGTFHAKMGSIKDRNGMDLTEADGIKKRWQEYTEELYRKDLNDQSWKDWLGFVTNKSKKPRPVHLLLGILQIYRNSPLIFSQFCIYCIIYKLVASLTLKQIILNSLREVNQNAPLSSRFFP